MKKIEENFGDHLLFQNHLAPLTYEIGFLETDLAQTDGMPSSKRANPTAYKTHEIDSASISNKTFIPKWTIEL